MVTFLVTTVTQFGVVDVLVWVTFTHPGPVDPHFTTTEAPFAAPCITPMASTCHKYESVPATGVEYVALRSLHGPWSPVITGAGDWFTVITALSVISRLQPEAIIVASIL